jgi:thiol-disulfide isomerase/thioredoxin
MPAATPSAQREPVRAPDFPRGFSWLNTDHPLTLKELRGRVVLLDFWTYCCINCQHILPDLAYLEQKYAQAPFTVIGVHSAKFDNEQDPANVRDAILRHDIHHPVVVDEEHEIWQAYGVRGWPTLVLLDPQGYVLGGVSGEGHRDLLDTTIAQVLDAYESRGLLSREPLDLPLERDLRAITVLSYPGKVLADAEGDRLFIADSGYHRLVIADLDGQPLEVIGDGTLGRADGSFETATFHTPQGMALAGDFLYVADTENHLLRRLNLQARTVETVAGTGLQARGREPGGPALRTALNSPWDLCVADEQIYIAMAGPHQIWRFDPVAGEVAVFAGSGREARIDGLANEAAFAQPSGIATDGKRLFVADSEISSVRAITLGAQVEVRTLAGGDLFAFGDRDGVGDTARLQHCLGIAYADGVLYLADTYNHKIKRIDPASGAVLTLLGDGIAGDEGDVRPRFHEPGGLSVAGDRLYIADTNNHRIQVADLLAPGVTGAVRTLDLHGLCAPGVCIPGAQAS